MVQRSDGSGSRRGGYPSRRECRDPAKTRQGRLCRQHLTRFGHRSASLVAALTDKTIAGAGLDVFEKEPHAPGALTAFPNVVLTPHIGGHTLDSHLAMQDCVIANLEAYFGGKPLAYAVR